MENQAYSEHDPLHHTIRIKELLTDLIAHLEEDVEKVNQPKAQQLFETSAEVLRGLQAAFELYEENSEPDVFSPAE